MRHGKMASQLGGDQKYYISRCEEKQSIQLTITIVGDDKEHIEERRSLIDDVTKLLDDIMKVFMPATKEKPSLLIPCSFCPALHILLDDACSGKAIFCPNDDDKPLPCGYYSELLQVRLVVCFTVPGMQCIYLIVLLCRYSYTLGVIATFAYIWNKLLYTNRSKCIHVLTYS